MVSSRVQRRPIFCDRIGQRWPQILGILYFVFSAAIAGGEPYLGADVLAARRTLARILAKNPDQLKTDTERKAWVNALLAAVALDRLEGEDEAAAAKLRKCGAFCEKFGLRSEWKAEMAWACTKKKETEFCFPEKIKAQKPPH